MNRTYLIMSLVLAAVFALLATSCSTTKKLGEGDVLYTGVKHLKYHEDSVKIDEGVKADIFTAINVRPNNPLYSPYYRTPFPFGLMIYNNIDENATGFKGWLYKHFAAKPVLIRRVNPQARVDMINTILRNNGYFTSSASYTLNPSSNPKKAKISYDVNVHAPYTIGNVEYIGGKDPLIQMVDSLARTNQYLQTGSRYCLDSLSAVRIDITNFVRNHGYYFFRPEYIQYLADSVQDQGIIHMRLVEANDIPNNAMMRYRTNDIVATVVNDDGVGEPDTIESSRCTLIKYATAPKWPCRDWAYSALLTFKSRRWTASLPRGTVCSILPSTASWTSRGRLPLRCVARPATATSARVSRSVPATRTHLGQARNSRLTSMVTMNGRLEARAA